MAFRSYYLAREWVRAGHRVKIVAASYSHLRTVQPSFNGQYHDEIIDGIEYRWYSTPPYKGNGKSRVINIFRFLFLLWNDAKKLSHQFKPDVVIASSTYPMDIWAAQKIAKINNSKLIFELHDIWPLSPIEIGGMSRWHPFIILCQLAENHIYRSVDLVISMLPNVSKYISQNGFDLSKLTIIPNGISLDDWHQNDTTELDSEISNLIAEAQSHGSFIVAYSGSHGLPNALDNLLNAASILREENIKFILVGDGHERERLKERVKNDELFNVHMFPAISKYKIPKLLSHAQCAYLGAPRHPLYRFGVSPNKMIDYMMAGIPILYAIEAGNNPIEEADCGISVSAEDPEKLAEAIQLLRKSTRSRIEEMGENGRSYALKNHTYTALANRFIDAIANLKD